MWNRKKRDRVLDSAGAVDVLDGAEADEEPAEQRRWHLDEATEIAPGRFALRRLGGGADHEVYVAFDSDLCTTVAVKIVRPHRLEHERTLRHLAQEAEMLADLAHPMIPRCFDAALEAEHPHIVLELIDGPSLERVVRKTGALDLVQLLPIAVQLAGVTQYLRNRGVAHLDIKPDNVVLSTVPKLIDLSLARSVESCADLGSGVGTPGFMAPEQCDPARFGPIGAPADVWGVGATLFAAANGRRPFDKPAQPDDFESFPQTELDPHPFTQRIPDELGEAVLHCLRRDPADRPEPYAVAEMLEPWMEGLPRPRVRLNRRPGWSPRK